MMLMGGGAKLTLRGEGSSRTSISNSESPLCSVREEPQVARTLLLDEKWEPSFLTAYESRTLSNGALKRNLSSHL